MNINCAQIAPSSKGMQQALDLSTSLIADSAEVIRAAIKSLSLQLRVGLARMICVKAPVSKEATAQQQRTLALFSTSEIQIKDSNDPFSATVPGKLPAYLTPPHLLLGMSRLVLRNYNRG